MSTTKTKGEPVACTCGHTHGRGERCGAIVSGTPMVNYCQCPGATAPGEHLRPSPESPQ